MKSLAAKICLIVIDLETNKYFHYLYALIFFIVKISIYLFPTVFEKNWYKLIKICTFIYLLHKSPVKGIAIAGTAVCCYYFIPGVNKYF